MTLIKVANDVDQQAFPKLVIAEKYLVNLRPFLFTAAYGAAIALFAGGAYLFGAGLSYADTRNASELNASFNLLAKSDPRTVEIIRETLERQDAQAAVNRAAAPLPPAAMGFGGAALFVCGIAVGWTTIYRHCEL